MTRQLRSPEHASAHASDQSRQTAGAARRRARVRKRWLVIGLPLAALLGLIAIAPPLPTDKPAASSQRNPVGGGGAFRYKPDKEAFALDFDPRRVRIDVLEGWDREQEAFADSSALAYISGPMYERHVNESGREITVPLGDLKLGERVWRGRNRTASRQRAFIGIGHDGHVDFGYGELTPERANRYDTFIGGLHSLYNDLESPPEAYKGAYSISMGQQIRYYLPRIRMVIGLRRDGRLEVLMSRDGLTLEQTRAVARDRGLVAAYLPDHASKSRFIIPGVKGFSEQDANWISGGATSFVHVPFMLRLSERGQPLQGNLLASLTPHPGSQDCGNPLDCGKTLGGQLLDRALAGFNRLVEQGIEPLARLIWAPRVPKGGKAPSQGLPCGSRRSPPTRRPSGNGSSRTAPASVNRRRRSCRCPPICPHRWCCRRASSCPATRRRCARKPASQPCRRSLARNPPLGRTPLGPNPPRRRRRPSPRKPERYNGAPGTAAGAAAAAPVINALSRCSRKPRPLTPPPGPAPHRRG
ncbi:hypothetical protein [Cyanobium sp. ATX-6F1]|uniref:hypothetical protein n=1 Tax=Cyanobium sp. ATX-6F1 TaxID=3137388 RepID=UPI0039BECB9E